MSVLGQRLQASVPCFLIKRCDLDRPGGTYPGRLRAPIRRNRRISYYSLVDRPAVHLIIRLVPRIDSVGNLTVFMNIQAFELFFGCDSELTDRLQGKEHDAHRDH